MRIPTTTVTALFTLALAAHLSPTPAEGLSYGCYNIRQASSGRLLDAYQSEGKDYAVVTREEQGDDTQLWQIGPGDFHLGTHSFLIKQMSSGRFLDAYTTQKDFAAVTRPAQGGDTQNWVIESVGTGHYTIRQGRARYPGRYLDAYQTEDKDYRVVTRDAQDDATQIWILEFVREIGDGCHFG